MNYQKAADTSQTFIRDKVNDAGAIGGIIGLSGGADSDVVARLSVNAIGSKQVYGLIMPCDDSVIYRGRIADQSTLSENTRDAIELAENLGIKYLAINIKPIFETFKAEKDFPGVPQDNLKARIRMNWLYYFGNADNRIVLGTSNKSELMTGYFTKYGDGGIDIEPIGDLYKTEVWKLAKYLGVSKKIIDKPPSADLSPGQTDEADLGMDYSTLDKILRGETEGIDPAKVRKVDNLVRKSAHKREMPLIAVIER